MDNPRQSKPSGLLRQAKRRDIPRIRDIRAAVRENRLTDPTRVTDADILWFIAASALIVWEDNGVVLGFSAGDPRDGLIWALFVHPDAEGEGIGQRLIDAAIHMLRKAGHAKATLYTGAGTRAEGFYRRNGWISDGHNASGEIIFRKLIPPLA